MALKSNRSLTHFYLKNESLGSKGVMSFADMLKDSSTLIHVELWSKTIGADGMIAIPRALKENKVLQYLDMKADSVNPEGPVVILWADALRQNNSLTSLKLKFKQTNAQIQQHFLAALEENKSLLSFSLYDKQGNNSFRNIRDKVDRIIERNRSSLKNAFRQAVEVGNGTWRRSKITILGNRSSGKASTFRSLIHEPRHFRRIRQRKSNFVDVTEVRAEIHGQRVSWKENTDASYTTEFAMQIAVRCIKQRTGKKSAHVRRRSKEKRMNKHSRKGRKRSSTIRTKTFEVAKEETRDKKVENMRDDKSIDDGNILAQNLEDTLFGDFDENVLLQSQNHAGSVPFTVWTFGAKEDFCFMLQQLFLTEFGVYLVVFDMQKILNVLTGELECHFLRQYLNMVCGCTKNAPVILVGSFYDRINTIDLLDQVNYALNNKVIDENEGAIVMNELQNLSFFPIDNIGGKGVSNLRSVIYFKTLQRDHMKQIVKLKWVQCLEEILSNNINKPIITMTSAVDTAQKLHIVSPQELDTMFAFFHELGFIFNLNWTEYLKDALVFSPDWLYNSVKNLVSTKSKLLSYDNDAIERFGLKEELSKLFADGFASRDLLEYIWGKEDINFMLDLLKNCLLISEWPNNDDNEQIYMVPSLMNEVKRPPFPNGNMGISCVLKFSRAPIPLAKVGLFVRLCCLCISLGASVYQEGNTKPNSHKPKLSTNWCEVPVGDSFSIHIEQNTEHTFEYVHFLVHDNNQAAFVLQVVLSIIEKIKYQQHNCGGITWELLLQNENGGYVDYAKAKQKKIQPWFRNSNQSTLRLEDHIDLKDFLKDTREA
eukprot:CAMPEP_0204877322 /NCGR_PEP_ID=MMETSP1348-20121228/48128_1 /ASSEMBLY_ACC=CAM_ASM_000700 /TAXON_ID=215587 /ORGANISM="Aplanochytrium stocchinoi, Strain GSBS06" /LENGTH=822 /DNA_ID=CAMNT_0052034177 /DNA_START=594 /DNA_END=3062 /DNA_ORIENTATION=+